MIENKRKYLLLPICAEYSTEDLGIGKQQTNMENKQPLNEENLIPDVFGDPALDGADEYHG